MRHKYTLELYAYEIVELKLGSGLKKITFEGDCGFSSGKRPYNIPSFAYTFSVLEQYVQVLKDDGECFSKLQECL